MKAYFAVVFTHYSQDRFANKNKFHFTQFLIYLFLE
jgi:hypothetical protein